MEEKKNKNKKILIVVIGLILIAGIGVTIAYFSSRSASDTKTITTGNLSITYADRNANTLILENMVPIYDKDIKTEANKIAFNITNNGNMKAYVDITIEEITMSEELSNLEFKWALYEGNTKVSNGNFRNVYDNKQLLTKNIEINSTETKNYELYIWLSENEYNQTELMNKTFSGKIVVTGTQKKGKELLSTVIKNNNSPITTTKPNFASKTTTDEGLIQDVDADGETYYFRGKVKDNYVKIDGLTWSNTDDGYHSAGEDMLWRIVRINGDGTIRLIADGIIGSSKFNTSSDNEKYIGYTYDNSEPGKQDGTNSTIKTYLEDWYNTNMTSYDKFIANTHYCNDTSISSIDNSGYIYYGAFDRISQLNKPSKEQPTFKCPITEKTYGGEYDLKVGLVSADEIHMAGGIFFSSSTFYMMETSNTSWSASPYSFFGYVNYWNGGNTGMDFYHVLSPQFVRPVVNLKADLLYKSGVGTKDNPYIIK